MAEHLDELNLDARQKQKAEPQIATLRAQLTGEPDSVIVRQAGRTLCSITEGAIGSLLATGVQQPLIWHWVQQTIAALFGRSRNNPNAYLIYPYLSGSDPLGR